MATTRVGLLMAAGCGVTLLAACGTTSTPSTRATELATSVTPAASGTQTPSATSGVCATEHGGTSGRARITDMRIGTTTGHDTLVIQFDTAVTRYELVQNATKTQFAGGGGQGGTFTLSGASGLRLNVLNLNWSEASGNQYLHGTDLRQAAPRLLEARQIGDFEGTANIAIGLSNGACPTVSILSGPPRLVLEFPSA